MKYIVHISITQPFSPVKKFFFHTMEQKYALASECKTFLEEHEDWLLLQQSSQTIEEILPWNQKENIKKICWEDKNF